MEYIIEEKATGNALGGLWYQWPMKFRAALIGDIVEIERKLASLTFEKSGSLYFNDSEHGVDGLATTPSLPPSVLRRYELGPLVSERMWRGGRSCMDLDRGPCECSSFAASGTTTLC